MSRPFVILEDDNGAPVAVQPDLVAAVRVAPKSLGREAPCCDLTVAFTGVQVRVKGEFRQVLKALGGAH